jgi:hypothetical protein
MKHSMDERLESVYNEKHFGDGDENRVWGRAEARLRGKSSPLMWAVPLAAAATVFVSFLAIPQARAAMVELLHRAMNIFDYMGMDKDNRPDNLAVEGLLQGNVPAEYTLSVQPGGEWVKKMVISVDEVLYDGKYIFIKSTMDPKGMKNFMVAPCIGEGEKTQHKEYMVQTFVLDGIGEPVMRESGPIYKDDGIVSDVTKVDATGLSLSGIVSGTLTVDFFNCTEAMTNGEPIIQEKLAATIVAKFSFDATEGPKQNRVIDLSGVKHALSGAITVSNIAWGTDTVTFTNRNIPLEGCYIAADTVSVKPTGIDLRLHFFPSASLSEGVCEDLLESVYPVFLCGGKTLAGVEHSATKGKVGDFVIDCSIPMEYVADIDTLTVQLWVRCQAEAGGKPIPLEAPVTLPCPPGTFMALYDGKAQMPGASFDIDITQ